MSVAVPPLVLLAGMNCTADLWADAGFAAEGAIGAIRPVLDRPSIAEQVAAMLDGLPETFVLVGHSLGGIVGMALALAAPPRVAGLCLVSTNAKAPTDAQRSGWGDWLAQLDEGVEPSALQQSILVPLLGEALVRDRPDLVQRTLRMGEETGVDRLRAQLRMQLTRTDLLARLPELPMPTLVVSGLDDAICPPHFHTEIVSAMPDARLVTLDAGHLLPLERPREFGRLVRSWMSQQRLAGVVA
ncbi:alpha/beta fold hydrolase [Microbacterium phyllosphaerae]|uniref:alpha/beta fold hydrolase n=1 Tax=Microbacterium phyllosphaerae TaxID=124798 RepID=UPI000EA011B3|nr:alpha/beta hydrolase [Microbacterium phyllosphaerae]